MKPKVGNVVEFQVSSDAPCGVKLQNSVYYVGLVNNHQFKIDGKLSCSFQTPLEKEIPNAIN